MTQIDAMNSSGSGETDGAKSAWVRWAWIPGLAILIKVLMFAAAFGAVAIYSHLIHTGEEHSFYQEKAKVISPIVAILLGFPLIFWASRFLVSSFSSSTIRPALVFWLFWICLDVPFLATVRDLPSVAAILGAWLVMFIAAYWGASSALPAT